MKVTKGMHLTLHLILHLKVHLLAQLRVQIRVQKWDESMKGYESGPRNVL